MGERAYLNIQMTLMNHTILVEFSNHGCVTMSAQFTRLSQTSTDQLVLFGDRRIKLV